MFLGLGNACSCRQLLEWQRDSDEGGQHQPRCDTRAGTVRTGFVAGANQAPVPIGKETVLEYRAGNLTIHYLPKSRHLDVWDRRKVLTVERCRGSPRVERYVPGYWEDDLEAALAKSRFKV